MQVPEPGVWSPGKDAEHVVDAAAYHVWIVRLSIREKVPPRPGIERARMTARLSQPEVVDLLRLRTQEIAHLVGGLTDQQLELPPRPPRALPTVADLIERVLIGHYRKHTQAIASKLRLPSGD